MRIAEVVGREQVLIPIANLRREAQPAESILEPR
jgi:hypothetical protein